MLDKRKVVISLFFKNYVSSICTYFYTYQDPHTHTFCGSLSWELTSQGKGRSGPSDHLGGHSWEQGPAGKRAQAEPGCCAAGTPASLPAGQTRAQTSKKTEEGAWLSAKPTESSVVPAVIGGQAGRPGLLPVRTGLPQKGARTTQAFRSLWWD